MENRNYREKGKCVFFGVGFLDSMSKAKFRVEQVVPWNLIPWDARVRKKQLCFMRSLK